MKKVLVAMSGGIDSTSAVLFLKEAGYEVIGVTYNLFKENNLDVLKYLGIKHYYIDLRKEFKNDVIDYFISEYKNGRTPNPCAVCNYKIKFNHLLKLADKFNCDFISTGHYAKIEELDKKYIAKADDEKKDQSYFLFNIGQSAIDRLIFPLSEITKDDVKRLIEKTDIKFLASKKESQDICFIDKNYRDFLSNYLKKDKGNIIKKDGTFLGTHDGIYNFTIGQKKGLGINYHNELYVLRFEGSNVIVTEDKDDLLIKDFKISNFIVYDKILFENKNVKVKVRYNLNEIDCSAFLNGDFIEVSLEIAEIITSGQLAVFYDENRVIGGGFIA
jgi:tRNA-specific 2-thiouridylase